MTSTLYSYSDFDCGIFSEVTGTTLEKLLSENDFVIYACIPKEDNMLYDALREAEPWKKDTSCVLTPFMVRQGHDMNGMPRTWVEFVYVNSDSELDYREYSLKGAAIIPTRSQYGRSLEHVPPDRYYISKEPYTDLVEELAALGHDVSKIEIPKNGDLPGKSMRAGLLERRLIH